MRIQLVDSSHNYGDAIAAAGKAIDAILADQEKCKYYYRTTVQVFRSWLKLLGDDRVLETCKQFDNFWALITSEEFLRNGGAILPEDELRIVRDYEGLLRQIDLMSEVHIKLRAGLAVLHICRFALRFGFSGSDPRIHKILNQIDGELTDEERNSIDDSCSLCTAVSVSCFHLARQGEEVVEAFNWLRALDSKNCRFAYSESRYTDAPAYQHGLHYTANILIAALDVDCPDDPLMKKLLSLFFEDTEMDRAGFRSSWMLYRNINRFEMCRFIFSGFLRYWLMGNCFDEKEVLIIRSEIESLVNNLVRDASDDHAVWRFYDARENLVSLVLGLALGVAEVKELMIGVVDVIRRRLDETLRKSAEKPGDSGDLIDSSVDRTQVLAEGLVQYWEASLFLRETT